MTTKLSSGGARFKRSTAALGIAGLVLAGIAGPAFADGDDDDEGRNTTDSSTGTSGDEAGGGEAEPDAPESDSSDAPAGDTGPDPEAEPEGTDSGEDAETDPAEESELAASAAAEEVSVDLVGLNDFHGRIDAGLDTDEDGSVITEGAAVRLAAAVEQARANNSDTFFVGAGDLYSASTFTSMAGDDVPTTDVFNAIGMDTSSVGNHEFDHGFQNLKDRIAGNGDYAGHAIAWEYLGANVYESGTTNAVLPEYTVLSTDDVDIAFIGLVTQETPSLVTPAGIAGLEFGDPAEAVERVISAHEDVSEADAIVVLTHDGAVNGEAVTDTGTHFGAFADQMAERGDIAGIFSGHTHTKYEVDLEVPTTVSEVGSMPVIQTGSFGENLGLISLVFDIDEDGAATFTGATSEMTELSGVGVPAAGDNSVVDSVRQIVETAVAAAEEIGSQVIGEAGADLLRANHTDPQTGNSGENRGGESTISNLIADAQLWAVHEQGATDDLPVIAFMNPGGVRTDIASGDVTYKQAADVQPFANTLETLNLTGAQIKSVLEEQWQPDGSSRPFLKLGLSAEFFYTYDPVAPRGERITAMYLDGQQVDLESTYRVVTNNFLASGGDNFFTLGEGTNYADTGLVDLAAFVDYFQAHDVVDPDYTQRAVGIHWVTGADTVYGAGDDVEIDVSSLAFSNGEPAPEAITATMENSRTGEAIDLGEFDVDASIVNTNDETGRASIAFTVPSEAELGNYPADWVVSLKGDAELFEMSLNIEIESTKSTVDLVGVNDFHGRIDAGRNLDEGDEGAGVRLAAAVEARRAANPDTFFVGAGDLYSASTFTSMAGNDIPTTDVFNAMGMDTSSVGNHEFDRGFQDLLDRIDGNGEYAGHEIEWEYLGANVYDSETGEPVLDEFWTETTGGIEIAFIGLVTEETPSLVTPAGIAGLEFGDPTEAVERVIAENQEVRDADTIVVLTHDGGVNGEAVTDTGTHFGAFAEAMAERGDIAGIFSGHTHTKYEVDLEVPTTVSEVGSMPVIQTGSFGDNLGLISLVFDIDEDGTATFIAADSGMTALADVTPPVRGANAVVDEVRDIVDAAVEAAEEIGSEVIGEAGADLLRANHTDPQTGETGENRGGESTISNLIADAQLWAVHEQAATDNLPVIAVMNPGGVRTDILEGEVTYKEVADVQPFANTLETLDLTGAQIKDVLEEQWQPDGASRPFLKLGLNAEFFYTYDPEAPRGERITQMLLDGAGIDLEATYRVVTNNFLASGGDNFFTLGGGTNYADTGLVDLAAFVDYFQAHDVVQPDYTQRAVGIHWVTGADTVYSPGDDVEIDVSSLAFSNDEPKPTVLSATLWGPNLTAHELGEFDVDAAVVNTNDETGRATVAFAVPEVEGLEEGVNSLLLTLVDDVGEFQIPLRLALEGADDGAGDGDVDGDDDADGDDDGDGDLPDTGSDVLALLIATALLLGIGGTALAVRRRQTTG